MNLWKQWRANSAFTALGEYAWLIEPSAFDDLLSRTAEGMRVKSTAEMIDPAEPTLDAQGTLRVPVRGVLMRDVPWILTVFGIEATSTRRLRSVVEHAATSDDVQRIHFAIDSPGGEVGGMFELVESIQSARAAKSVTAHTDHMAASAAYLVASQAERFTASPGSLVGSIGVLAVLHDLSARALQQGVKPIVIKSAPHKGTAEPGTPITKEQIDDRQRIVDGYHRRFVDAVASGRRLPLDRVVSAATGQLFHTDEALTAGLIDAVQSDASPTASPTAPEPSSATLLEDPDVDKKQLDAIEAERTALLAEREVLIAERDKLKARIEADDQAFRLATDKHKTDLIEAAVKEGRVVPAMRVAVDAFAQKCAPAELATWLAALPVQTRPQPIGQAASNNEGDLSADEAELARILDLDPKYMRAGALARGVHADGTLRLRDGRRIREV